MIYFEKKFRENQENLEALKELKRELQLEAVRYGDAVEFNFYFDLLNRVEKNIKFLVDKKWRIV